MIPGQHTFNCPHCSVTIDASELIVPPNQNSHYVICQNCKNALGWKRVAHILWEKDGLIRVPKTTEGREAVFQIVEGMHKVWSGDRWIYSKDE